MKKSLLIILMKNRVYVRDCYKSGLFFMLLMVQHSCNEFQFGIKKSLEMVLKRFDLEIKHYMPSRVRIGSLKRKR